MTTCGKPCNCPSYRDHLLSIAVAPSATPTRHPQAAQVRQTSENWEKDLPAYKRLREGGYQPKHTDGAAQLERALDDVA